MDSLPPDGVLVRVKASGVCHSDLHLWQGYYQIGKSKDELLRFSTRPEISYPIAPGHEIAGVVHSIGTGSEQAEPPESNVAVPPPVRVGERVVVFPWTGCLSDRCVACAVGDTNACSTVGGGTDLGFILDGGYAEFVAVPHHRFVLPLPEAVPFPEGSLLPCSGLTSYAAIKKCLPTVQRVRKWAWPPSSSGGGVARVVVVVVGLGGVGQSALTLLPACLGKDGLTVVGVDLSTRKAQVAEELGLVDKAVALSARDSVEEQVKTVLKCIPGKAHAVLDFVNSTATFELCLGLLAKTGVHVMVGLFGGVGELRLPIATLSGCAHVGSKVGTLNELKELLEIVKKEKAWLPTVKLYKLEDAGQALKDLENGLLEGRAVLDMQD